PRLISSEDWDATPPSVRNLVLLLLERSANLEQRLNPTSRYAERTHLDVHSRSSSVRVGFGSHT
ncbi:MAG: hypothetical protein KGJ80_13740, partial [Chloroflexota bacterium]|nr:hypothetical protein [Chloroflexota bacterium]